jgi:diguanylate cyclase (GGDEF)-like protein
MTRPPAPDQTPTIQTAESNPGHRPPDDIRQSSIRLSLGHVDSPHPTVVADCEGNVISMNAFAALALQRQGENIHGRPITELLGPSVSAIVAASSNPTPSSDDTYKARGTFLERIPRRNGAEFPAEVTCAHLHSQGQRITIIHFSDVSGRYWRDPLTGLPTRTALLERISHAIARAERHPDTAQFALVFIDLDRFRSVNDAHGIAIGDDVLVAIGRRIRQTVRRIDAVAQPSHLDRDEFAVLLEDLSSLEDVRLVAQRLIDTIRKPIILRDGSALIIGASIGIAAPTVGHTSAEALLQDAETAMRRAKATPSEPCQVFDFAMHARVQSRLHIETELRAALTRDEFVLQYQPIVSLASGKITSCEALVRWVHPKRGVVPPLEFIAIAEAVGLIVPLGNLVLEKACQQAHSWSSMGLGDLSVAVNVSARQLSEDQLVDTVKATLARTGLAPHLLKIEITETAAASNPDGAILVLRQLKELGVELLIDDFGTGYSSLSRLTRFPLDKLKIDRSFVAHTPYSKHDNAVASTIVAMAHSLGLGVIAEGVETYEQAAFLRLIECEEMQGYLFSQPVSSALFEEMARGDRRFSVPMTANPF